MSMLLSDYHMELAPAINNVPATPLYPGTSTCDLPLLLTCNSLRLRVVYLRCSSRARHDAHDAQPGQRRLLRLVPIGHAGDHRGQRDGRCVTCEPHPQQQQQRAQ